MSHVQKITTKSGRTRYRARWLDPTGDERCKTFDLKRQADKHLEQIATDMLTGKYADPRAGRITVRAYAQTWAAAQPWEDSTRAQHASYLNRHIYPAFGDRPINSVRPTEIQGWITGLTRKYKLGTARGIVIRLTSMMAAAVTDKVIGVNPCISLTLPERDRTEVTIPTPQQVAALHAAAPARYKAAVLLAAGLGLRQSEMTGLTIDRITFPSGAPLLGVPRGAEPAVTIDQQLCCLTGRAPFLKQPKTRAGVRAVPLADTVADALVTHLAAHPITHPWGLVLTADGTAIHRKAWSEIWTQIRAAAGVPDVRYHHLRHYYASSLIRYGASIKEVQARMGHSSSRTTLDVYGHLWPDSADRSRAAVQAALTFDAPDDEDGAAGVLVSA